MRLDNALRRTVAAAALASLAAVAGCDTTSSLLEVQDPDIINPADVSSPAAARALRVGTLARLATATSGDESTFLLGGLLADEWRSSDTFVQRNEADRRAITPSNAQTTDAYRFLHRARLGGQQAVEALTRFEEPAWTIAEMYFVQAFTENQIAQDFCGHLPFSTVVEGREELGSPLTTDAAFERALAHADSGLALLAGETGSNPARIRNALSVLRGRILVNLGRYDEAAAAVANVPDAFEYVIEHSANTSTNTIWSMNNSIGRWYLSQGEGGNGLNFAVDDPRLPICHLDADGNPVGCGSDTQVSSPFDPSTPLRGDTSLIIQQKWPERYDPVAIITGTEARLIEAEAELRAGDPAGALLILNELRSGVTGLAPLTLQTTAAARENQLFNERAYWLFSTGTRLNDLRRLVRDYGRTVENTFPTGAWWKGGEYGTDVNIPVPQAEENNPNFARASCVASEV